MSDNSAVENARGSDAGARSTMQMIYILYAASILVGITSIVGLIMAYMNREKFAGTIYESHATWLIRTFWISLIAFIVSTPLVIFGIGALTALAAAVWAIYRIVRGFLLFNEGKPLPDAKAWI